MSAAKFTRMKIYIGRNKSLSNTVQIYDVTYMPRQAALVGYIDSTHRREREKALSKQDTISSRYQAENKKNA